MRFGSLALLLLAACATTGPAPRPQPLPSREGGETAPPGTWHPVIEGETLWRIANHYGVSVNDLIGVNAVADPTELRVGRRLFVPLPPGSNFDRRQRKVAARPSVIAKPAGPDRAPEGGFIWPVKGRVLRSFGKRGEEVSDGLNIAAERGAPVLAAARGTVVYAAEDRGWGQLIIIEHDDEWVSIYAHNEKRLVEEGARVGQGDVIASVGESGRVRSPQLHFELRRGVSPKDPAAYLPKR